jgi:hypothetical protein
MIGAVGEIAGAAAVVASLIYVARQMKHAASVAAVEGFEAYNTKIVDFAIALAQDDKLAELLLRAETEGLRRDDLSLGERGRLGYTYIAVLTLNSGMFQRWRHGLLTQEEFDQNAELVAGLMAAPYLHDVWPIFAPKFAAEYRAWVEQRYDLNVATLAEGTA